MTVPAHLWERADIDAISSLPTTEQGDVSTAKRTSIRGEIKAPDLSQCRFHFLPFYENDVWSMIVISNLNADKDDRMDGTSD